MDIVGALGLAAHELALFAAIGLAIGGIDDLLVDVIWMGRSAWRRAIIYRRHRPATAADLSAQARGRVAVFVPAWREAEVIGAMAAAALSRWAAQDLWLYIGCYPNDPQTISQVRRLAEQDKRVRLVINPRPGPTTKADGVDGSRSRHLSAKVWLLSKRPLTRGAIHDGD